MSNYTPEILQVARMQKFGDRFILAEDIAGRHYIFDARDSGPVRPVVYFQEYEPSRKRH